MENLVFSLNAVLPIFILIGLGYILRKVKLINGNFVDVATKFNFCITFPAMLFLDVSTTNIFDNIDGRLIGFAAGATIISFIAVSLFALKAFKGTGMVGAFIQGAFRGNFVIMGMALMQNMYDQTYSAPIVLAIVIPFYNALSVLALAAGDSEDGKVDIKHILKKLITNPIILSIIVALPCSFIGLKLPFIIQRPLENLSSLASPLSLIAIGGGFDVVESLRRMRPAIAAASYKLIIQPLIFISAAILFGFRGPDIAVFFILFASPTSISSFATTQTMGGDGTLASNIVVITTFISVFTLTGGLFMLKSLGFL